LSYLYLGVLQRVVVLLPPVILLDVVHRTDEQESRIVAPFDFIIFLIFQPTKLLENAPVQVEFPEFFVRDIRREILV
jgi:hypothetical protein